MFNLGCAALIAKQPRCRLGPMSMRKGGQLPVANDHRQSGVRKRSGWQAGKPAQAIFIALYSIQWNKVSKKTLTMVMRNR